ncbi:MAG: hypothetical protein JWR81_5158 [Pseudonocardia sp.]|nr:hypothetical protein [Pseudonocardia sp.]
MPGAVTAVPDHGGTALQYAYSYFGFRQGVEPAGETRNP